MIYPPFLSLNDTIGITAPSLGVGNKIERYNRALSVLNEKGYKIKESESVRRKGVLFSSSIRAKEFMSMVEDDGINFILMATGGDFLFEILNKIDFKKLIDKPKWVMGMSDPSSLLFILTTIYDVASLYGHNASFFDTKKDDPALIDAFNIMRGDNLALNSYEYCYKAYKEEDKYKRKVRWKSRQTNLNIKGRLIGGCADVLRDLAGTKFDGMNIFNERYKTDGIIFYFDIYALKAEEFMHILWTFKECGWFEYCRAILLGRVAFPESDFNYLSYTRAIRRVLGKDIIVISEMDIGHTAYAFTLINGSICQVELNKEKGKIIFELA